MSEPARTYNQEHVPRKYVKGRRRVSVYISWSYPGEANRDVTELDNRYSTMTEVRRVLWPEYESPRFADPLMFQQGIAGSLELFFWAWVRFQQVIQETTGHGVPVFQRVDQAGFRLPLDERVVADADTLLVFGLDHMVTEQEAPRRRSRPSGTSSSERAPASSSVPIMTLGPRRRWRSARWSTPTMVTHWCPASSGSGDTRAR
ncbi:hypothetical protein ACN28S_28980 [Cystobacter fuscus]